MASHALERVTVDEFLAGLESESERLELIDGMITAMVGGSVGAHLIAGNIFASFYSQLRGRPCMPFGDGMLLKVSEHNAFAPDVMIVCSPIRRQDQYVSDPTVIVEVLSPSTENLDRGFKWLQYQTIVSLRHYLLVAQDRQLVEVFSREREGPWVYEAIREPGGQIALPAVDIYLPLAEIYEGVDLAS